MRTPAPAIERPAQPLEALIRSLESQLESLAQALRERDSEAISAGSARLQRSLQQAMAVLSSATAQGGGLPDGLRPRLAKLQGAVAAERESLARASAAVQRAMNVLMPATPAVVYAAP
ncbi:hypothetical protein [Ramlibacter sp. 2FC]|uniref:hypothetical protein n=1 Tax=Ramlibacter sp. 2FC TaxID=2502188 RepID=UPI0010F948E5|nr:hypothetical protein [Ramlibacter sp. 2FC]